MTNKLNLRSILFLLAVSNLVSGTTINTTVSGYTKQSSNETYVQSTTGPPQTKKIREGLSAAGPTHSQNTTETAHSRPAQGNGTSGNFSSIEGTETNSTEHHLAGNERLSGTESPLQTPFLKKNGSSDPTMTSPAPVLSASVGRRNETNATDSVPIVVTTTLMGTNGGPSSSRTTVRSVVLSSTEIRTTQDHTPTKPHNKSSTTNQVCPTAELKKESLVGQCLIVITCLAALGVVFIMTTIILATKLAGVRYRHRASLLHDTEMVCISALMNDSDHPIPAPRRPKSNGALIPITEDEDGDDLTLNSFLHDTEGTA